MERVEKKDSIEVRYSWVICGSVSYISALYGAWVVSGAILTDELRKMYAAGNSAIVTQATFVASFSFTVYCFATLFGAVLMRYVGLRPVGFTAVFLVSYSLFISPHNPTIMWWTLTYGVQAGLGFGFMAICTSTIQPQYFDRNHGLNYGIILFSSGLMTLIYPIAWTGLLKAIGFSGAMYVFGGLFLTSVVPVMLLKPRQLPPSKDAQQSEENADSSAINVTEQEMMGSDEEAPIIADRQQPYGSTPSASQSDGSNEKNVKKMLRMQLLKNKSYLLFILGTSLRIFGMGTFTLNIISLADLYFPDKPNKLLVSVMGITQCISRLISAWMVDRVPLSLSYYILQLMQVLIAMSIIGITYIIVHSKSFAAVILGMAVLGLSDGPALAMQFPIMCRMVQRESVPIALSFQLILLGICAAIGPTIIGVIIDVSDSYALGMYISTIPVIIGSIVMFFANLRRDVKTA